jgi:hypothetical protein
MQTFAEPARSAEALDRQCPVVFGRGVPQHLQDDTIRAVTQLIGDWCWR